MINIATSKKLIVSIVLLIVVLIIGGVRWFMGDDLASTPPSTSETNTGKQITQTGSMPGADTTSGTLTITGDDASAGEVTISGAQNNEPGADADGQGGMQGGDIAESDALKDPDVQEVLKLFEDLTR